MLIFFMLGVMVYDWRDLLGTIDRVPKLAYIAAFAIAYAISFAPVGGGI